MPESLVIVGGCGHVGLPLGMAFALKGYKVKLLDISEANVKTVNSGVMPFVEEDADALLPEVLASGMLKATTDFGVLASPRIVLERRKADFSKNTTPAASQTFTICGKLYRGAFAV